MVDIPAGLQAKRKRDLEKCTACRQDKVKCSPQNRDWEGAQQKCEHCIIHKKACGPNYRNKDDPAVLRRKGTQEEASSHLVLEQPLEGMLGEHRGGNISETAEHECQQPARKRLLRSSVSAQTKHANPTAEQLAEKALSGLDELNALGTIWTSIRARNLPANHPCNLPPEPSESMFIKTRLELSFISVYNLGVQCYDQDLFDQTRWIFYALLSALERYNMLRDGLKRGPLLKMANIFQNLGHQWDCERILTSMTRLHYQSAPAPVEDPCLLLANSLPDTSELIAHVLTRLWKESAGDAEFPGYLLLPALQRAAQIPNAAVTSAILAHHNGINTRQDNWLHEQRARVTASMDCSQDVIHARLGIDDRDLCGRTALFSAAANGLDQCCLTLILGLAGPNSRDRRGHSILEVAAAGGHLEIVKNLIDAGADPNPQLTCCASSPLQAAIDTDNPNMDLVRYLLEKGASIDLRRPSDDRTAIDIADRRGHSKIVELLRQRIRSQPSFPFDFGGQNYAQGFT